MKLNQSADGIKFFKSEHGGSDNEGRLKQTTQ
jgi:hypothetical protein